METGFLLKPNKDLEITSKLFFLHILLITVVHVDNAFFKLIIVHVLFFQYLALSLSRLQTWDWTQNLSSRSETSELLHYPGLICSCLWFTGETVHRRWRTVMGWEWGTSLSDGQRQGSLIKRIRDIVTMVSGMTEGYYCDDEGRGGGTSKRRIDFKWMISLWFRGLQTGWA